MAMEARPPHQFPSLGGGGPRKSVEELNKGVVVKEEEEEGEERTWTTLGQGARGGGSQLLEHGKATPVFTPPQLFELQRQIFILSYISAGLPVPPGHLFPLGEDFHLPSFVGFSPQDFNYSNLMEPEPGRCRRTDGKKWRCKKAVVPDHKYCERHMHRGCNRSRKLVEASVSNQTANPSETPPPPPPLPTSNATKSLGNSSTNNLTSTSSPQVGDGKILNAFGISSANIDISVTRNAVTGTSIDVNLTSADFTDQKITTEIVDTEATGKAMTATSSNVTGYKNTTTIGDIKVTPRATTAASSNAIDNKNKTTTVEVAATTNAASATNTIILMDCKSGSNDRSHHMVEGGSICCNSFGHNNMTGTKSSLGDTKLSANTSLGLDISPKSVLQDQGCRPSCFYRIEPEHEPWRCRRTDGRKWRCRRDVIPDQKYCAMHIHRGAKRRVETFRPSAFPTAKEPSASTHPHPNLCLPNKDRHVNLNTKLSISIPPANSHLVEDGDSSTTSCSSDATVSDTMTS